MCALLKQTFKSNANAFVNPVQSIFFHQSTEKNCDALTQPASQIAHSPRNATNRKTPNNFFYPAFRCIPLQTISANETKAYEQILTPKRRRRRGEKIYQTLTYTSTIAIANLKFAAKRQQRQRFYYTFSHIRCKCWYSYFSFEKSMAVLQMVAHIHTHTHKNNNNNHFHQKRNIGEATKKAH